MFPIEMTYQIDRSAQFIRVFNSEGVEVNIRVDARPPDMWWIQHKLCYMPVNRAASNSVRKVAKHAIGRQSDIHMIASTFKYRDRKDWFIFTFVRNPFTRLVSGYLRNVLKGKLTDAQIRRGFKREMEWPEFVEFICSQEPHMQDKHYVQQVYRLSDNNGTFVPHWVGKIESMVQDWKVLRGLLQEKTGVPWAPKMWSVNKRTWKLIQLMPEDYMDMLPTVKRYYADDYQVFNYDQD